MSMNNFLFGAQLVVLMTSGIWLMLKKPELRTYVGRVLVLLFTLFVLAVQYIEQILLTLTAALVVYMMVRTVDCLMPVCAYVLNVVEKIQWQGEEFGPEKPQNLAVLLMREKRYDDDADFGPGELGFVSTPTAWDKMKMLIDLGIFEQYAYVALYCAVSLITLLVIGFSVRFVRKHLLNRFRRQYQEFAESIELSEFVAEKMAPGSVFMHVQPKMYPKCQASVMISVDGGPFVYSGQCFRVGDSLFTAWHVVQDATEIKIFNPAVEQYMTLSKDSFKQLTGDIAEAKLSAREMSMLQLKSAKFAGTSVTGGDSMAAFVEITAIDKKSMGLLTPHSSFSYVTYSGSTCGGFSGAPYVVNNTVYGMHIGHQSVNLGYDGAYMRLLVEIKPESTADYLFDQFKRRKGKGFKISRSPYDPDEYFVRVDGKYYRVDEDEAQRLSGVDVDGPGGMWDYYGETAVVKEMIDTGVLIPRDVMYQDSGNVSQAPARNDASAGADGNACLAHVVVPTNVMQNVYQTPTSQFPTTLNNLVTALPASMPAEQNKVLDSTVKEPSSQQTIDLSKITMERVSAMMQEAVKSLSHKKFKSAKRALAMPSTKVSSPKPSTSTGAGASK